MTNTGKMAGKEVVQLYVADKESTVIRPVKELKEFAKIELAPGETKTVTFSLSMRAFAYFNTDLHDWHVESGEFDILIGQSSRNIVCQKTVYVRRRSWRGGRRDAGSHDGLSAGQSCHQLHGWHNDP